MALASLLYAACGRGAVRPCWAVYPTRVSYAWSLLLLKFTAMLYGTWSAVRFLLRKYPTWLSIELDIQFNSLHRSTIWILFSWVFEILLWAQPLHRMIPSSQVRHTIGRVTFPRRPLSILLPLYMVVHHGYYLCLFHRFSLFLFGKAMKHLHQEQEGTVPTELTQTRPHDANLNPHTCVSMLLCGKVHVCGLAGHIQRCCVQLATACDCDTFASRNGLRWMTDITKVPTSRTTWLCGTLRTRWRCPLSTIPDIVRNTKMCPFSVDWASHQV